MFAKSAVKRYAKQYHTRSPTLGTHVDDIFGGFKESKSLERANHFRTYMCEMGAFLNIEFNMKITKTPPPAREQIILGRHWSSITRRVKTAPEKQGKYLQRLREFITGETTTRKELERVHGYLAYVANIEPYGKPFLAHLTTAMSGKTTDDTITIPAEVRLGLEI